MLAFFAPNDRKYYVNVMPFGPTSDPSFYTIMTKDLKDEWDSLFIVKIMALKVVNGKNIKSTTTNVVTIGDNPLV